jgi:hypothetical protein
MSLSDRETAEGFAGGIIPAVATLDRTRYRYGVLLAAQRLPDQCRKSSRQDR